MRSPLAIGDFSRATHLSVKTLRHYHRVGLLEPADVDPDTGHRRYTTEQIPTAQVIRRFRALEMPLEEIRAVLATPDVDARNELIASHLSRLEDTLARTQVAAASLRELLQPPRPADEATVEHRNVRAAPAAAVREVIEVEDASTWCQGALGELYATLAAQRIQPAGPAGGIFSTDLFTNERGEATVFVPCESPARATGRVQDVVVPPAELAITVHSGPPSGIDRA
jgi:DNA-binding transcriptional MerR regulator